MESPAESQPGTVDYEAVLADLRGKRAAIDQAIQSVELVLGISRTSVVSGGPTFTEGVKDQTIRADSFFNMTIVDAVKKYLAMSKQPRSLKDILAALESGGFVHDSANFYATVHSSLLRREKLGKDVIRVKRKWALIDWYPSKRQAQ